MFKRDDRVQYTESAMIERTAWGWPQEEIQTRGSVIGPGMDENLITVRWDGWEHDSVVPIGDVEPIVMKTFSVIEYSSFYAVRHNPTGEEHPMGDGVDTIFLDTDDGMETVQAGDPRLIPLWEDSLNADEDEVLAAYFPHLIEG